MKDLNIHFQHKIMTLLKKVGHYQIQQQRGMLFSSHEKQQKDLVSEIDIESEKMLQDGLYKILPEASFYGEESSQIKSSLMWIVDPIDGTTNYIHGLGHFAISVALWVDFQPAFGIIYQPANGECYSYIDSQGYYNDEALTPLESQSIGNSLISTGFPFRSPDTHDAFFNASSELLKLSRGIRRFGAASLDLALTARGAFQAFFEVDLQIYDVACGLGLLQSAGAQCINFQGDTYDAFEDRSLLCAHPGLIEKIQPILKDHYRSLR